MLQHQVSIDQQPQKMCSIDLLTPLVMCVMCNLLFATVLRLQVYFLIGVTTGAANRTAEWQTNTSAAGCSHQSSETASRVAGAA